MVGLHTNKSDSKAESQDSPKQGRKAGSPEEKLWEQPVSNPALSFAAPATEMRTSVHLLPSPLGRYVNTECIFSLSELCRLKGSNNHYNSIIC